MPAFTDNDIPQMADLYWTVLRVNVTGLPRLSYGSAFTNFTSKIRGSMARCPRNAQGLQFSIKGDGSLLTGAVHKGMMSAERAE